MAPKAGLSQAQKLEKILDYFRQSKTCHTLKDLESALPGAASVHKMQVKDLVKELTDESKVKIEKIGSGNWYWCWAGEEAQEKKKAVMQLEAEKSKLDASNRTLQQRVGSLKTQQAAADTDTGHQALLHQLGPLEEEVKALTTEKDEWENAVAGGIEGVHADTEYMKKEAVNLTDNIYILEEHLQKIFGGDRGSMDMLRQECYGDYYVEEGLPDLDEL